MQVRLERQDLGVLGEHGVGVQFLAGLVHALDVDVHAVAERRRARCGTPACSPWA